MQTDGAPLTLALYEEIESRMRSLRAAYGVTAPSEYAFSNLYLFRRAHDYRYFPGELPYVAGTTYDGTRHVLPLFDPRLVSPATLDGQACLYPLPEDALQGLDRERFSWTDSPDDADYFYPASNFREYRGDLLRKKRNLMQQLLAAHTIHTRPLAEDTLDDAGKVLDAWLKDKGKHPGEADDSACREALQLHRHFSLDGIVYYAGEQPAGFLVAQPFSPMVAVMRFAKGSDAYKGIYQYMFHHYCISRPALEWLNFEQDMGLSNFRQTKRSYQPSAMLRKYRVHLR